MSQHSRAAAFTPIITVTVKHALFQFKIKERVQQPGDNSPKFSTQYFIHHFTPQGMRPVTVKNLDTPTRTIRILHYLLELHV